jgi:hypothetical protein
MSIPIPIPVGVKRVTTLQGAALKLVLCEECTSRYGYRIQLEAQGEDYDLLFADSKGSERRAQQNAEETLKKQEQNRILPVPCPVCGYYQADMARLLQADACVNRLQMFGAAAFLLSFVPLLTNYPFAWVISAVGGSVGVILLLRGYQSSWNYDPNFGDVELRKEIGRRTAIWGKELEAAVNSDQRQEPEIPC